MIELVEYFQREVESESKGIEKFRRTGSNGDGTSLGSDSESNKKRKQKKKEKKIIIDSSISTPVSELNA